MKKIGILIAFMALTSVLFSQNMIMDEKPDSLYNISKWGKNRTNYIHFYGSYGFVAGAPEGNAYDMKYGLSREWKFGIRYKLRVCNFYAMGLDFAIAQSRYRFAQTGSNTFPDSVMHDQEYLGLSTFGLDYYNRFNFGKRGNKVGKYLDLGVYSTYTFSTYHRFVDKLSTPYLGSSKAKTKLYGLNYINDIQWGFKARIGKNRYALWATYRMSDWFNSKVPSGIELPRAMVGVEIGMF
jgi:hypothetical protein